MPLIEVGRLVLDHLDGDHLLRLEILAFDHLSKRALAQHVENEVSILVVRLFGSQNVVDVEDVITILIVVAVILNALTGLGQHASRIARRLVLEARIADAVGRRQMCRQRLQGTDETALGIGSPKRRLRIDMGVQAGELGALPKVRHAIA